MGAGQLCWIHWRRFLCRDSPPVPPDLQLNVGLQHVHEQERAPERVLERSVCQPIRQRLEERDLQEVPGRGRIPNGR